MILVNSRSQEKHVVNQHKDCAENTGIFQVNQWHKRRQFQVSLQGPLCLHECRALTWYLDNDGYGPVQVRDHMHDIRARSVIHKPCYHRVQVLLFGQAQPFG